MRRLAILLQSQLISSLLSSEITPKKINTPELIWPLIIPFTETLALLTL